MYILGIAVALFAALATAAEVPEVWTDATSFGAMLARSEVIEKRQGYTPGQRTCGTGLTCEEACGVGSVQCPSNDRDIHCHFPSTGTHCCTDGTGNACGAGFYCTTDGRSNTYCCPDGIENVECARLYSLSVSLIRETTVPALPSASSLASKIPVLTPLSSMASSLTHITSPSTIVPTSRPSASLLPAGQNSTLPNIPSSGVTGTSTRTNLPEFTAAAAKAKGAGAGMAVLAGAAGLLL